MTDETAPTEYKLPVGPLEAECLRLAARLAAAEGRAAGLRQSIEDARQRDMKREAELRAQIDSALLDALRWRESHDKLRAQSDRRGRKLARAKAELADAHRGPCAQCVEDVPLAKAAVLSIFAELYVRFKGNDALRDAVNEVVKLYAPELCTPIGAIAHEREPPPTG
jgi:hypothetical protein